jgi:hypothetical protein
MAFQQGNLLAGVGVPDAGGAVVRRRHHARAVGAEAALSTASGN